MIEVVLRGAWGIACVLLATGCFSPQINSGEFRCADGLCPEGFRCEDGLCLRGGGAAPDLDASAAGHDGAVEVDAAEVAVDGTTPAPPCYGEPAIQVVPGTPSTGDTSVDGFDNAGGCATSTNGPEHYYELVLDEADVPAMVTVDVNGMGYDVVLRVRQAICDDLAAEFVCQDDGGDETYVDANVEVAGSYFIIVDSHTGEPGGEYELLVTVTPL